MCLNHSDPSIAPVNEFLQAVGETPITKRKITQKYSKQKMEIITSKLKEFTIVETTDGKTSEDEIIKQLKEKFHTTSERSEKVQILTVLPRSWSIKKIESEFSASNYMIRKAKELVKVKGILSTPDPKPGSSLPGKTSTLLPTFIKVTK